LAAPSYADDAAADEINWLIDLVSGIRSVRSEMNVPPAAIAPLVVVGANSLTRERWNATTRRSSGWRASMAISLAERRRRVRRRSSSARRRICLPLGSLIDLRREGTSRKGDCQERG
jgi:valyl-tRNA synthetase